MGYLSLQLGIAGPVLAVSAAAAALYAGSIMWQRWRAGVERKREVKQYAAMQEPALARQKQVRKGGGGRWRYLGNRTRGRALRCNSGALACATSDVHLPKSRQGQALLHLLVRAADQHSVRPPAHHQPRCAPPAQRFQRALVVDSVNLELPAIKVCGDRRTALLSLMHTVRMNGHPPELSRLCPCLLPSAWWYNDSKA